MSKSRVVREKALSIIATFVPSEKFLDVTTVVALVLGFRLPVNFLSSSAGCKQYSVKKTRESILALRREDETFCLNISVWRQ